tara:strand:+ start:1902 stop:2291 length:390 start_codon:yes stop_codon:yes gene_type:complete
MDIQQIRSASLLLEKISLLERNQDGSLILGTYEVECLDRWIADNCHLLLFLEWAKQSMTDGRYEPEPVLVNMQDEHRRELADKMKVDHLIQTMPIPHDNHGHEMVIITAKGWDIAIGIHKIDNKYPQSI